MTQATTHHPVARVSRPRRPRFKKRGGRYVLVTGVERDRDDATQVDDPEAAPFYTGPVGSQLMLVLALTLSGAAMLFGLAFDLLRQRESRLPSSSAEPEVRRPFRELTSDELRGSGRVSTVLLAEGDPRLRPTLSEALQHAGHTVITAESSDAVLRILPHQHISVLVLDMSIDGWTVLRQRSGPLPLTIVVTDEEFSPRDMRELFQARPVGILHKPVSPARLVAAVAEAIETASAQHEPAESDVGPKDAAPDEPDEHPDIR